MSNWLFKRDLNAETISQFGYVWVEFRQKMVYIKSRSIGKDKKWSHVWFI